MNTNILHSVTKTFQTEWAEMALLIERVDDSYEKAIALILQSKGKVVVSGIGKTAFIAQKMVATLNSTGTKAQFLHASEAIHGDLGLLDKEDVVICISNSGNSAEIKAIAPILKERSTGLIAITGNNDSYLAKTATYILSSKVEKEACPNNLAPTSSTLVQMAICDAIAVALMEEKNFKSEDFAHFHPGGSLGKNLTTKVSDLVKPEIKPFVQANDSVKEVILSLSSTPFGVTVVMEGADIIGIVTDGDLRRNLLKNEDFLNLSAQDIMTKAPKTIQKEEMATFALQEMKKYDIGELVVLDQTQYFGIIEIHQLLEEGII